MPPLILYSIHPTSYNDHCSFHPNWCEPFFIDGANHLNSADVSNDGNRSRIFAKWAAHTQMEGGWLHIQTHARTVCCDGTLLCDFPRLFTSLANVQFISIELVYEMEPNRRLAELLYSIRILYTRRHFTGIVDRHVIYHEIMPKSFTCFVSNVTASKRFARVSVYSICLFAWRVVVLFVLHSDFISNNTQKHTHLRTPISAHSHTMCDVCWLALFDNKLSLFVGVMCKVICWRCNFGVDSKSWPRKIFLS